MLILVTGGAGFVGTNLIKELLKKGHKIVSVDNYSTGKKENHIKHKDIQYLDIVHFYDQCGFLFYLLNNYLLILLYVLFLIIVL